MINTIFDSEKKTLVYIVAVFNTCLIGLSFLFAKISITTASPIDTLAYRFTIGFIGMSILVLFGKVKINLKGKNFKKILLLSVLYSILFFTLQIFGLKYTTSSEGAIISASIPIITMILATIFLKEKINWKQKVSIFISVLGIVYIFYMQGMSVALTNYYGFILLLLSSISFACYNVVGRWLSEEFTPVELSFGMLLIGCVFYNIWSIIARIINGSIFEYFSPLTDISFFISVFYLGIACTLGTSLLTIYILSKMEAAKASIFSNLSIVISIFAGICILNETLHMYDLVGSILIILGVFGTNYFNQ